MFNMFAGGAVQRMAIFALNIMPYISASIIIQLLIDRRFRRSGGAEEGGRRGQQADQPIHALSHRAALAAFQSYGFAVGLRATRRRHRSRLVLPHSTVITLTGGTMFLMWLGEQITSARHRATACR